jgi:Galactose oxidase, central domain
MFGNHRAHSKPRLAGKNKRRNDRKSARRFEQLEERLTLSSNPTLSIPTTTVGVRGSVVAVPINVNHLTDNPGGFFVTSANPHQIIPSLVYVGATRIGLGRADFAVDFDPNVFSVANSDVMLGTIPSNVVAFNPGSLQPTGFATPTGWIITVSQSPSHPGQLDIHIVAQTPFAAITSSAATSTPQALGGASFFQAPDPIVAGEINSLVMIDFHIKPTAPLGATQINLAANNLAGASPTDMFDATGRQYTLNPAPTNGAADRGVDGTVTVISAAAAPAFGTWATVTPMDINLPVPPPPPPVPNPQTPINPFDFGLDTMLLLPDGSIMAHAESTFGQSGGPLQPGFSPGPEQWYRLTPDGSGSYANGTWSTMPTMGTGRAFFGSVVLPDDRVMVMGGEFVSTTFGQAEDPTGEIYDPATNTWTPIAPFPQPVFSSVPTGQNPFPPEAFGDGQLELMNDGTVLAGFLGYQYGTGQSPTFRYDPASNLWVQDATLQNHDRANEESWVKLGDGSMLAYEVFGTNPGEAERLVFGDTPAQDQWVDAGHVPVSLATNSNNFAELGAGTLLPDGRVFYLGATSNTALYTPPSPGNPTGTWVAGPLIPNGLGANDAPAAVEPNGRVLFISSATPTFGPQVGTKTIGTSLFEFDPVTNTIRQVTNLPVALSSFLATNLGQYDHMTLLPNGQIIFSDTTRQMFVYTPSGAPQDAWRPTISSIEQTGSNYNPLTGTFDNVFTLTGTQLNGLDEGAYFGDDAQQATNYPLIQLTSPDGTISYATTFNWSSDWVATGSTPESVDFSLPNGTTLADYVSFRVIANGISSLPTSQIITLGVSTAAESVTIIVDPANSAVVDILNGTTLIATHPNNQNSGAINIVGDANNNSVTIDETNGIVNVPITFDGGGAATIPPGDQFFVIGAPGADNLVITPTSATSATITDNGSAPYSFTNVQQFTFDGAGGTNSVAVLDTLGGASMDVSDATVTYNGGTPFTVANTQNLLVSDASKAGNDTINVIATSLATTVGSTAGAGGDTINVGSDAPANQFGVLTSIGAPLTVTPGAGKNTLVICDGGSFTTGLTMTLTSNLITADDLPIPISYSQGAGKLNVVLDGSNGVATTFDVLSTLPALNSVTLNGGLVDGNVFNLGSDSASNNGILNALPSAITVAGGTGAGNLLEIDDHGSTGTFNYNVTDTTVSYDRASSPPPATFGGVTYSGIDSLQLDATEQPNTFTVAPSFSTVYTINGYGPELTVPGIGDSLAISTLNVSGPVTNNSNPEAAFPASFDGNFTFADGHVPVYYTDIESFPTPILNIPILAYAPDAGPNSQPLVKVVDARTGQLISSFLAFAPSYTGGVSVAVGYFDGTGQPEIAVAPGKNHSPTVEVFDPFGNLVFQFQAYAANFVSGISIAAGNVENQFSIGSPFNGSHEIDDIVTAPTRGVSDIRVFHNQFPTNPAVPTTLLREFTAWSTSFIGGSTVAVAHLKPSVPGSWADIIVGSGSGMAGTINAYDVTLNKKTYIPFESFVPFGTAFRGGVNVAAIDPQINSNVTVPTIVASQGPMGTGQVSVLNGITGAVQYHTAFGGNLGVRTAVKVIGGRLYVYAAPSTNAPPSTIKQIDPNAGSIIDFILEFDPEFNKMFLG